MSECIIYSTIFNQRFQNNNYSCCTTSVIIEWKLILSATSWACTREWLSFTVRRIHLTPKSRSLNSFCWHLASHYAASRAWLFSIEKHFGCKVICYIALKWSVSDDALNSNRILTKPRLSFVVYVQAIWCSLELYLTCVFGFWVDASMSTEFPKPNLYFEHQMTEAARSVSGSDCFCFRFR